MGPEQEASQAHARDYQRSNGSNRLRWWRPFLRLHDRSLGGGIVGPDHPVYFIADIGANHDGSLSRAKELIKLAAEAGANCVKFQHFQASKIVSAIGFDGFKTAHQRGWDKSVFEVYEDYSINPDWNQELANTCAENGVQFMTTPYDKESVDSIHHLVPAYKIGSGEITNPELIKAVAVRGLPTFMATGASTMEEVKAAVSVFLEHNSLLCLMQCNTNYTGDVENFKHVNLNVLSTFRRTWPHMPLGLSDHTSGYVCVLGAVALGAVAIEKHFTDDPTRKGPDHGFALDPNTWQAMVYATRKMESAMGDGHKICEANEIETRVVQRRALRLKGGCIKGGLITHGMIDALRPCPNGALTPAEIDRVVGKRLAVAKKAGEELYPQDIY